MFAKLFKQIQTIFSKISQSFTENPLGSILAILFIAGTCAIVIRTYQLDNLGFSDQTLFNWLQLVIIPVTLAVGAYLFSRVQSRSDQLIAANHEEELLLQGYMDAMSELILEKRLSSATGDTQEDKDLRNIARSRTLITLRGLVTPNPDGNNRRRGSLLRFLFETELIDKNNLLIDLKKANFEVAYARKFTLKSANLERADFYKACLRKANLREANLKRAYLVRADLRGTDLRGAILIRANFRETIFGRSNENDTDKKVTDLRGADLTGAKNLAGANLKGVIYGEYKGKSTKWPEDFDPDKHGAEKFATPQN